MKPVLITTKSTEGHEKVQSSLYNRGKRGKRRKNDAKKLVLLRERSDRKGPRAPEAKFGKRNSGSEIYQK